MKNILFIALALILTVSTASASAADGTYTDYFIAKKRAEASKLKHTTKKKVAMYQHLIANNKEIVTVMSRGARESIVEQKTASGGEDVSPTTGLDATTIKSD